VLIKVGATGLNARDLWILRKRDDALHVPCSDNVGFVVALGQGVTSLKEGDRVIVNHYANWIAGDWDIAFEDYDMGDNIDGFLAEYALAPAAATVRISNRLPDVEACTLNTAGLTAWRALAIEAQPQPGETVVTLGTGGVSVFNIQVARMFSTRVIVTSSNDAKLERVKPLGADLTVNYRTVADWSQEVLRLTSGRGADVVLNNVGYLEIERCLAACGNNARVIHIGASREQVEFKPLQNFFTRGCSIKGIANGSRRMLEQFLAAYDHHRCRPLVDKVYRFDQAVEAVRAMEGSDRVGKLVIDVAAAA
jgi:NADPH:quinone reductase-like Zn-dependent oxidoreductase